MDDELFSIGEVARQSGLSVSALRFYDREDVLTPIRVDPVTAYRWYSRTQVAEARLVASLRRVGLGVLEISTILAHRGDGEVLRRLLGNHVARLEDGLAAAKAEIGRIEATWAPTGLLAGMAMKVDPGELRRALSSVRFAIGDDATFPSLHGVLLEVVGKRLRLTATDRHRAAFCEIEVTDGGPEGARAVVSAESLDDLDAFLNQQGVATLTLDPHLCVRVGDSSVECAVLDTEYPDLSRVLPRDLVGSFLVDAGWLAQTLLGAPGVDRCWLNIDHEDSSLTLTMDSTPPADSALLLDSEFLSQAVEAFGTGQLRLEIGGPVAPLAIRSIEDPGSYSVLMPIRRD